MKQPHVALLADIHYNLVNYNLANSATQQAIEYCRIHKIPLVIAGDLHDTKALLRGEVVNGLINTFQMAAELGVKIYLMTGNHDLITEKSSLMHSLNFLAPYCDLVDRIEYNKKLGMWMIPYQNSTEVVEEFIGTIDKGSTLIMHQGLRGAHMGEYLVDKTSVRPEVFDGHRVISGHYHRAQDIKCGKKGLWSYIGSPYTVTYAEAHDGPKGFRVLNTDGSLDLVPTNLRKHVIEELDIEGLDIYINTAAHPSSTDLLWLKVKGPSSELAKLSKKFIGERILGHSNFRLDLIPEESAISKNSVENKTGDEILDDIIEKSEETKEQKLNLKKLWREIMT